MIETRLTELTVAFVIVFTALTAQHLAANSWPWARLFGWMAVAPLSYIVGVSTIGAVFTALMVRWGYGGWPILAFWTLSAGGLATIAGHATQALLRWRRERALRERGDGARKERGSS
jgi:hypothetical protein